MPSGYALLLSISGLLCAGQLTSAQDHYKLGMEAAEQREFSDAVGEFRNSE